MVTSIPSSIPNDMPLADIPKAYPYPYPAPSKTASGLISDVQTDVFCMYFSDKIVVTISQAGRLGQWIQVPLSSASPTSYDTPMSTSGMLLPLDHLTPKTMLGAGGEQRERMGHLYASQIASMILAKDSEERRTVMIGFGLEGKGEGDREKEREGYFDLLELVRGVL